MTYVGEQGTEWIVLDNGTATLGAYRDDHKVGPWLHFGEDGTPMKYPEWEREFITLDWAFDDNTGMPRGENWPMPPPDTRPVPE